MEIKTEYKRDMNHNYLILHAEESPDTENYAMRMLTTNSISGLLDCSLRIIDSKHLYYYEITDKKTIKNLYDKDSIGYHQLKILITALQTVLENVGDFLLDKNCLVLKPEYIFVNTQKEEFGFVYCPGYVGTIEREFQDLMEVILDHLDSKDRRAIVVGYEIYKNTLEENYTIQQILNVLYRLEATEEFDRKKEEVSEKSIYNGFREENEVVGAVHSSGNEPSFDMARGSGKGSQKLIHLRILCGLILVSLVISSCLYFLLYYGYIDLIQTGGLIFLLIGLAAYLLSLHTRKSDEMLKVSSEEPRVTKKDVKGKENFNIKYNASDRSEASREVVYAGKNRSERNKIERNEIEKSEIEWNSAERNRIEKNRIVENKSEEDKTTFLYYDEDEDDDRLVPIQPGIHPEVILAEEAFVLGKDEKAADYVIFSPTVSRLHARVEKIEGNYYVTDLNSMNGTYINGVLLEGNERRRIKEGDKIQIADIGYVLQRGCCKSR